MNKDNYTFIGAGIGHCAGIVGCQYSPERVKNALALSQQWLGTANYEGENRQLSAEKPLYDFSQSLGKLTLKALESGRKFITFGGDHSCAIGTWSAVAQKHPAHGLIWIDAHMDAHTPETSHSGNFHGMPLATLLGHGAASLTKLFSDNPKLSADNVFLIGIRSFEEPEATLLKKLGAHIYMMEDVEKFGFAHCLEQAIKHFKNKKIPYGISFDLDGLDPEFISAVGTPVEHGISLESLKDAFSAQDFSNLLGIEIVEYNPTLDETDHGIQVIEAIMKSLP